MSQALYVHIPFCRSICSYCDFCRVKYSSNLADRYLTELEYQAQFLNGSDYRTVYVGGGTPSSLDEKQLERLLGILKPFSSKAVEYTIEVNPETVNEEKVRIMKDSGINRVSIGVQSFRNRLLMMINRSHTTKDVYECIDLFRKNGIDNISIDLMYGLPEQTVEDFTDSINKVIRLEIPHVSFYGLTIEPNSEFGRNGMKALDSNISDDMYFEAIRQLNENGYHQYEISNFCKEGYESKHNLVYWHYEDFDALGMGASGKKDHQRFTNTRNFVEYFKHNHVDECIELSREDEMFETVMMGLRLKDGIDISDEIMDFYDSKIDELVKKGMLLKKGNHVQCTEKSYYILNDVLVDFLD